jgi:hypothetical protein
MKKKWISRLMATVAAAALAAERSRSRLLVATDNLAERMLPLLLKTDR